MIVVRALGKFPQIGVTVLFLAVGLLVMWDYSRLAESKELGQRLGRLLVRSGDRFLSELLGVRAGTKVAAVLRTKLRPRLRMAVVPRLAVTMAGLSFVLIVCRFAGTK